MEDAPGPAHNQIMVHPANSLDISPLATEPQVREWVVADRAAWDAYVLGHPRATFFHQAGWKRVLEATFGYPSRYLLAERASRVCGVLPLFCCRSLRGAKGLYSLPHTVYGGPLADDRAAEEALLDAARTLAGRLGARSIDLRNRHAPLVDLPAVEGFVTFEKALPSSADEVRGTFPKKAREALNQATKRHRLTAEFETDLDAFYDLLAASYLHLGTPVFPKRFFASMLEEFPGTGTILMVRHEGRAVSAVLSMEFRDTVLPLYSGEAAGVRNLKANNFKYFRLMQLAVERGLKRFDFGRSRRDNEGVVAFKANQGFVQEALPYATISLTGEAPRPADPNKGIFPKIRRIWRKLPPGLARRAGPAIIRYFP